MSVGNDSDPITYQIGPATYQIANTYEIYQFGDDSDPNTYQTGVGSADKNKQENSSHFTTVTKGCVDGKREGIFCCAFRLARGGVKRSMPNDSSMTQRLLITTMVDDRF